MIQLTPKQWIAAGVAGAAIVTLGLVLLLRGGGGGGTNVARTGEALAAGLKGAMDATKVAGANRCARLSGHKSETMDGGDSTLVLGVIADTRGARAATLKRLEAIRKQFDEAGVELVVSLGGLATNAVDIKAVLASIAQPATRPVLALPGDREAVDQHRQAVAALAKSGANVFDGSLTRFVTSNGVSLGTFPGVAKPSQLIAGPKGCVHTRADADEFAAQLAKKSGVRVWLGYAPPRQIDKDASDVTTEGVHIGERSLTQAVRKSRARVVLHGLVDEAATGSKGASTADKPVILAAGAADSLPSLTRTNKRRTGTALVVWISSERIRWTRL